ncbi:class F sortase [Kitasatospora sp. NPDC058170]|uniref:class F sortase n=1 Tax=Kitasatospora sp. NPDC058170 TaxID=3346364 RepID=UPI0036D9DEA9
MRAADTGSGPSGHPVAPPPYGHVPGWGGGPLPDDGRPGTAETAERTAQPHRTAQPDLAADGGGRPDRAERRRGTRPGGRHGRRTVDPGPTGLRRTAFGAAGLLCLVIGATVALSGPETPVVRVETSVHNAAVVPGASAGAGAAAPATASAPAAPVPTPQAFAASVPTRLLIPAAGVDAPVTGLGLNADGTVEVPSADRAGDVGWYRNGPTPGETGPSVLIGHYDTAHGPAVFHAMPKLKAGDAIQVRRADGSTVSFRVRTLLQAPKNDFPTETVYGDTKAPELHLITCGGRIGADGHWTDNIIVLADLATPTG